MRQSVWICIPEEYKINRQKGLCPVCGKDKSQWDKGQRVYCSYACNQKHSACFVSWNQRRIQILKRDNYACVICGAKEEFPNKRLEVDHIVAIVNGGNMWADNNLRTLCNVCHGKKTGQDVIIKNRLKNGQSTLEKSTDTKRGEFP